jgi:hypothetical protein
MSLDQVIAKVKDHVETDQRGSQIFASAISLRDSSGSLAPIGPLVCPLLDPNLVVRPVGPRWLLWLVGPHWRPLAPVGRCALLAAVGSRWSLWLDGVHWHALAPAARSPSLARGPELGGAPC